MRQRWSSCLLPPAVACLASAQTPISPKMALRAIISRPLFAAALPSPVSTASILRGKQTISRGIKDLLAEANAKIETIPTAAAIELYKNNDGNTVFVDLRDPRELEREGKIPGAVGGPRR